MTLIELYILNNHVDTYLRLGRIDFIIYSYIQSGCNTILTLTISSKSLSGQGNIRRIWNVQKCSLTRNVSIPIFT